MSKQVTNLKQENGDIYSGEVIDEIYQGKGVLIFANGDVYDGDFKDGAPEGVG